MKISIGFSPCPNDTYVFDAMVNQLINTAGIEFELFIEDVETLNEWALEGRLDVTKLSFPALFNTNGNYQLLDSGAALGKGVGPLLVARHPLPAHPATIHTHSIALPGLHTTAHLLFSMAFPEAQKKQFMLFSSIEDAVLSSQTDLGVLIHENRFTYKSKGLHKVVDLGHYWEEHTGVPIPLGGIAIRSNLADTLGHRVEQLIASSLLRARAQSELSRFVREQAQSMREDVIRQHIDLYVNDYTLSLGSEGKKAIRTLYDVFQKISGEEKERLKSERLFLGGDNP